jgi:hypothetical protein
MTRSSAVRSGIQTAATGYGRGMTNGTGADDRPVEEIAEDSKSNTDETTRREAFEQALEDSDRSDEGAEVGDQIE